MPLLTAYLLRIRSETVPSTSSIVIDHLQSLAATEDYGVAYFYFDYKEQDKQRPSYVLTSLVKQLATQATGLSPAIKDLRDRLEPKQKLPTTEELYSTLLCALKSFAQVFFVFDALDECDQESQRRELLSLFHHMGRDGARLFLTSRQHPEDIQDSFRVASKIELLAKKEDMEKFIQQKIHESPRGRRLVQQGRCKERIVSELVDCSKGM